MSLWFRLDELGDPGEKQIIYEEGGRVRGLNIYADGDQLYVGAGTNEKVNGRGRIFQQMRLKRDSGTMSVWCWMPKRTCERLRAGPSLLT